MTKVIAKSLLALGMLVAAMPAAQARGFRGGVYVGPVIAPVYRPFGYWGPYGYPGYYYGGPGYYYGGFGYPIFDSHPNAGQVKIDTKQKDAQVFIDGAYAGTAKDMKSTWLKQGTYDLEVRAPEGPSFATQIYVVAGKTMHIRPQMPADSHS